MGLPYWGHANLIPDATITARTAAASPFNAAALNKRQLHPAYRSAGKALELNGSDESAAVAHHADFNHTGDKTIEFLIEPDSVAGTGCIIDKRDATDGITLTTTANDLKMFIDNSGETDGAVETICDFLVVDTPCWGKAVYDATANEISFWKNGVEMARANNATQTGCVLTGTIPGAIGTNTENVTIGQNGAGAWFFDGRLGYVAWSNEEHDNSGRLSGANCKGSWGFDNGDLADSSGNNHTLTGTNLDSTNFVDCTSYIWIRILCSATQNPALLVLDGRHNLSAGAAWKFLRGSPYTSHVVVTSGTVTPGQPIVSRFSSTTTTSWWLEIHDPNNPDGYIEIPHVYLGSYASMERAHLSKYDWSQPRPGAFQADSLDDLTGCLKGEQGWSEELKFRSNAADLTTLQAVIAEASRARPVVFCEDVDSEATKTRLVQLPSALRPRYKHVIGSGHFVWLPVREVSCGL